MKKSMYNATHIEGILYEHDLQLRESGANSKNPGTKFIMGTISIATDNAKENIVPVHFTYVTATYGSSGKENPNWKILNDIIDGKIVSVMDGGADAAAKIRIDSNIGLNEFYTDKNGQEELVSAKRNEGGFIHLNGPWKEDEKDRNTFDVDIVITGVKRVDADEEHNIPEKVTIKGAIFDYRKALLPVEFIATNPQAMDYFEGLDASAKNPVFTRIKGRQVSTTVVRKIVEESAFGEASVREVPNSRKEWIVTWAQSAPYDWDDENTITAKELTEAMTARETYLATVKQRADEYKAQKAAGGPSAIPTATDTGASYNF